MQCWLHIHFDFFLIWTIVATSCFCKHVSVLNKNSSVSAGGRGPAVCPNTTRPRPARTRLRQGLCSSSGRTQVQERFCGPTQQTKYPKNEPDSSKTEPFFFFPAHVPTSAASGSYLVSLCEKICSSTVVNMFYTTIKWSFLLLAVLIMDTKTIGQWQTLAQIWRLVLFLTSLNRYISLKSHETFYMG